MTSSMQLVPGGRTSCNTQPRRRVSGAPWRGERRTKLVADNEAAGEILPMNLADKAEMVWRKVDGGQTLEGIGTELGWTKQQAHQYANLRRLVEGGAWAVVSTTLREQCSQRADGSADSQRPLTSPRTSSAISFHLPLTPASSLNRFSAGSGRITLCNRSRPITVCNIGLPESAPSS